MNFQPAAEQRLELSPRRGCEPWVAPIQVARAPEGRKQSLGINSLSPLRGSGSLSNLTQGSQNLALGLTLAAAPQLVESSRLMLVAIGLAQRHLCCVSVDRTTRLHLVASSKQIPINRSAIIIRRLRRFLQQSPAGFLPTSPAALPVTSRAISSQQAITAAATVTLQLR